MIRGLDVDCGCFGAIDRKAGLGVILEDLAMLYLSGLDASAFGADGDRRRERISPLSLRAPHVV